MSDDQSDADHDAESGPALAPGPVWFIGDHDDPWVSAIGESLAAGVDLPVRRIACAGALPESLLASDEPPRTLVLHRATLTRTDAERVVRLRSLGHPPMRIILCVGPHVRHAEIERWANFVEAVVPEGTAADRVARLVLGQAAESAGTSIQAARIRIAVVSNQSALRGMLLESVEALGYETVEARDWDDAPKTGPALWDVPVLEPGWTDALARRTTSGPVVVLLGFADRVLVAEARAHGALACLDLPFDLADLAAALAGLAEASATHASSVRNEPGHPLPPVPTHRKRARATVLEETSAPPLGRGAARETDSPGGHNSTR
ncbi:MAG: hypothetical protein U0794_09080 [Isosphaeraceae bacterium]